MPLSRRGRLLLVLGAFLIARCSGPDGASERRVVNELELNGWTVRVTANRRTRAQGCCRVSGGGRGGGTCRRDTPGPARHSVSVNLESARSGESFQSPDQLWSTSLHADSEAEGDRWVRHLEADACVDAPGSRIGVRVRLPEGALAVEPDVVPAGEWGPTQVLASFETGVIRLGAFDGALCEDAVALAPDGRAALAARLEEESVSSRECELAVLEGVASTRPLYCALASPPGRLPPEEGSWYDRLLGQLGQGRDAAPDLQPTLHAILRGRGAQFPFTPDALASPDSAPTRRRAGPLLMAMSRVAPTPGPLVESATAITARCEVACEPWLLGALGALLANPAHPVGDPDGPKCGAMIPLLERLREAPSPEEPFFASLLAGLGRACSESPDLTATALEILAAPSLRAAEAPALVRGCDLPAPEHSLPAECAFVWPWLAEVLATGCEPDTLAAVRARVATDAPRGPREVARRVELRCTVPSRAAP